MLYIPTQKHNLWGFKISVPYKTYVYTPLFLSSTDDGFLGQTKNRAEYNRINSCVLSGLIIPNCWNSNAYMENSKHRTHQVFM